MALIRLSSSTVFMCEALTLPRQRPGTTSLIRGACAISHRLFLSACASFPFVARISLSSGHLSGCSLPTVLIGDSNDSTIDCCSRCEICRSECLGSGG